MGTLNLKTIFSIFLQKQTIWNLKNKTTPKQTNNNKKKKTKQNPALISEQSYNLKSFHQDMNMTDQVTEHCLVTQEDAWPQLYSANLIHFFTQLGIYITEELKSPYGCNNP